MKNSKMSRRAFDSCKYLLTELVQGVHKLNGILARVLCMAHDGNPGIAVRMRQRCRGSIGSVIGSVTGSVWFCTGSVASRTVLKTLNELFTRWGLPEAVTTDNGPQFTSFEFTEFLR